MSRRPKDIGTEGETAWVRCLRVNGFPKAERRALAGANDLGDVINTEPITFEVKWGKTAEAAGPALIDEWMAQAETERINDDNEYAVLVVKRKGVGKERVGECWAYMTSRAVTDLMEPDAYIYQAAPVFPVRMFVRDALALLRWAGHTKEPAA